VIDSVIQQSPCEVAVVHGGFEPDQVRRVLIPFGANIHTRLAVEIAPLLVEQLGCQVEVVVVFEPDTPAAEKTETIGRIQTLMRENQLPGDPIVHHDREILPGVLMEARGADLLVMGGLAGDFLELLFGRSLTQEITEQTGCPVLWLKEVEERGSFWRSLFAPLQEEVGRGDE
jgi:nucleotide-binding universal stress UspA family protein